MANITTTTIPLPTIPTNWTDPGVIFDDFINYWQTHTFNIFIGLISALFIFTVFLRTRSLSATLVASGLVAIITGPKQWLILIMIGLFGGILVGLWRKLNE